MITNHVALIGRITADPEMNRVGDMETACANFTLAIDRRKTQKEPNPEADFVRCTAWGHDAEFMEKFVKKGTLLGVEGRLKYRKWEDKEGRKCSALDVVVEDVKILERKKDSTGEPEVGYAEADTDELPFD